MAEDTNEERKEVQPLPGVVTSFRGDVSQPIEWDVTGTAGTFGVGTDLSKGQMSVPLSNDPVSAAIRDRELVRARLSPVNDAAYKIVANAHGKAHNFSESMLRAAENARILNVYDKLGFDSSVLVDGSEKIFGQRVATAGTPEAWNLAVEYATERAGTKAFDQFASGIRSVKPEWSKYLRKLNKEVLQQLKYSAETLGGTTPKTIKNIDGSEVIVPNGFDYALKVAKALGSYTADGGYCPDDVREQKRKEEDEKSSEYGDDDDDDECEGDSDGTQPSEFEPSGTGPMSKSEIRKVPDDFEFDTDGESGQFADLRIDDSLPLTVMVPGYLHRKKKALATGRRVSYPARMWTDDQRRVFGGKVKVEGGILVFDMSGSMGLRDRDIDSILAAAPAATILGYSQRDLEGPNAWILARNGRRVDPSHLSNIGRAGNGVDGPALTWAIRHAKYREKIIWVCDGYVTSSNDGYSEELAVQCAQLVKKHKIIMLPDVETAVKAFKTKRLVNQPAGPIRQILLGKSGRGYY